MDQRGVYYISRLKLNHTVYIKNPSPEYFQNDTVKKQIQYIQVDLEHVMNHLKLGQTYEIKEAYIGKNQKLFTRVIIYRLTDKQIEERRKTKPIQKIKRGLHFQKRGINIYVSNTPEETVPMEQIHDFYSLRWQIEIIFKTWKS